MSNEPTVLFWGDASSTEGWQRSLESDLEALEIPYASTDPSVWLPKGDGAGRVFVASGREAENFAQDYYQNFGDFFPMGVVIVDAVPSVFALNQLTCPYLLIEVNPEELSDRGISNAIQHHAMRYGDLTDHWLVERIDEHVVAEIAHWILKLNERPRQKQEKAA